MSFISDFKDFALKGSLIDLAVGIIIGAAVSEMVGALVDNILMPIIGVAMGGVDFKGLSIDVGDAAIGYGAFIQALIDFLIIAFVLFLIIRVIARAKRRFEDDMTEEAEEAPADVQLLTEIRDLLAARQDRPTPGR